MKEILKKKFPSIFRFLKNMYVNTAYYKNKCEKLKEVQRINQEKKAKKESKIMNDVFNNEFIVQNGHFKGMKYIKRSNGSALLPKILGSYEEPIQKWIIEVIENEKYKNILDIGCAEGYYACGFSMRMPNVKITAYDINEDARKNSIELKELNGLSNIEIKAECTHEELNSKSKSNTLVFCDIEGFEQILLDPSKAPNLKYVDMLIESHDWLVPNITEELISRFYETHSMRIIVDYPYRINKYDTPKKLTNDQFNYITDEIRPKFMKFIYMKSFEGKI